MCFQSRPMLCDPMEYIACQASLSMGFPRQEHCSGLPFPPPGDSPNPGIEPASLASPALAARLFITEPPGNNTIVVVVLTFNSACLILNILWNFPHLGAIPLVLLSA